MRNFIYKIHLIKSGSEIVRSREKNLHHPLAPKSTKRTCKTCLLIYLKIKLNLSRTHTYVGHVQLARTSHRHGHHIKCTIKTHQTQHAWKNQRELEKHVETWITGCSLVFCHATHHTHTNTLKWLSQLNRTHSHATPAEIQNKCVVLLLNYQISIHQ